MRRPKLGQHFLRDSSVSFRIVDAAKIDSSSQVLEIGPGKGALTFEILKRAKKTWAVEKDNRLAARFKESVLDSSRLEVFNEDFLNFDLGTLGQGPFIVWSNLPYAVGIPILQKLLDWPVWTRGVFMLQKEVAERLVATQGTDYGILSLSVFLRAEAELLFEVSPSSFSPAPKVSSAVVRLIPRKSSLLQKSEEDIFYRLIKAAFSQRRKMALGLIAKNLGLSRLEMERYFANLNIHPQSRAEDILPESYLKLARALSDL